MSAAEHDSRELTQADCLALLATVPFGRIVFTEGALPAVIPVGFVLDGSGIVVGTPADSSVARIPDGTVVALQADEVDAVELTGWSVTVVGQVRSARDGAEVARPAGLPLRPWAAGDRDAYVQVEIGLVSGRRIGGPAVARGAPAPEVHA